MRDWRNFDLELYTFISYLLKKIVRSKKTIHMIDNARISKFDLQQYKIVNK